jgi:hypothetical protein
MYDLVIFLLDFWLLAFSVPIAERDVIGAFVGRWKRARDMVANSSNWKERRLKMYVETGRELYIRQRRW